MPLDCELVTGKWYARTRIKAGVLHDILHLTNGDENETKPTSIGSTNYGSGNRNISGHNHVMLQLVK
jgi:hypothetical protein